MTMTTTASVTVSYLFGEDTISVTASCQGYPDAIADARAEAVRGLLEILADIEGDEDEDDEEPLNGKPLEVTAEAATDDSVSDD